MECIVDKKSPYAIIKFDDFAYAIILCKNCYDYIKRKADKKYGKDLTFEDLQKHLLPLLLG